MDTKSELIGVTYCLFYGKRSDGSLVDIFLPICDTPANLAKKYGNLIIADDASGTNRRSAND